VGLARLKELLPGQAGKHGRMAKDNRLFINAVEWRTRTGTPRRDISRQDSGTGTACISGFAAGRQSIGQAPICPSLHPIFMSNSLKKLEHSTIVERGKRVDKKMGEKRYNRILVRQRRYAFFAPNRHSFDALRSGVCLCAAAVLDFIKIERGEL
jgi:hypothetical protein